MGKKDKEESLEIKEPKLKKEKKEPKEKKEKEHDTEKEVQVWMKKSTVKYNKEIEKLQIELLRLQTRVIEEGLKVLIIFEGRDSSGKGGTIKRIIENLNPRGTRVIALGKPSDIEKTQWYFQRYVSHLPSAGEIVLFDRSWYNRAGVESVMGFCSVDEHTEFLDKVPKFENMIISSGVKLIKIYLSITKDEQGRRFKQREDDPLKRYKLSPVDKKAQEMWDKYSMAKYSMLIASHNKSAPWKIIRTDNKKKSRLNAIKYILSNFHYEHKLPEKELEYDPEIVIDGYDEIRFLEAQYIFKKPEDK